MRYLIVTLSVFLLSSCAAQADSQLERLEAAHDTLADKTFSFMQDKAPNVAKLLPDMSWDVQTKTSMQCYLGEIKKSKGAEAVDKYVSDYEEFAKRDFESFRSLNEVPTGLDDADFVQVNESCGMMKIAKERMAESGYDKVFSDPDLMRELSALFVQ